MRISLRYLLPAAAAVAAAALVLAWFTAPPSSARLAAASDTQPGERAACGPPEPGQVQCFTVIRTGTGIEPQAIGPDVSPAGWGPNGLRSAYKLTSATAGSGRTIAIVDPYDDPNAESDLHTYRAQYGLGECTTTNGCFRKVNQNGVSGSLPPAAGNTGWAAEESLDLDMVSAICPACHIVLVEANSPTDSDVGTAVNSAVKLAKYVSNSYGRPERSGDPTNLNHYFNHPGVALTFSAGDDGYGVSWPAASRYVTAVGGTSLHRSSNARGWYERAWSGTGSGCSRYSGKPSWQPTKNGCPSHRTVGDVAAVADPNTGVAIYDTYDENGWLEVGGTSVSAPIIAAVYARSAVPTANTYPASYPYRHKGNLFDVVGGSNGTCTYTYLCKAVSGYDGPTGLGTPNSSAGFKY